MSEMSNQKSWKRLCFSLGLRCLRTVRALAILSVFSWTTGWAFRTGWTGNTIVAWLSSRTGWSWFSGLSWRSVRSSIAVGSCGSAKHRKRNATEWLISKNRKLAYGCPGVPAGPSTPFSPLSALLPGGPFSPGLPFLPGSPGGPGGPAGPGLPGLPTLPGLAFGPRGPPAPGGPALPLSPLAPGGHARQSPANGFSTEIATPGGPGGPLLPCGGAGIPSAPGSPGVPGGPGGQGFSETKSDLGFYDMSLGGVLTIVAVAMGLAGWSRLRVLSFARHHHPHPSIFGHELEFAHSLSEVVSKL